MSATPAWTAAERAAVADVVEVMREARARLPDDSRVGDWLDAIRAPMTEHLSDEGDYIPAGAPPWPCEQRGRRPLAPLATLRRRSRS